MRGREEGHFKVPLHFDVCEARIIGQGRELRQYERLQLRMFAWLRDTTR